MYQQVNTSDPDRIEFEETRNHFEKSETKDRLEDGQTSIEEDDKPKVANEHSEEAQLEHVPYPKSVFFIISNEFCERFSYYGMRTILSLYLRDVLLFSEGDSTVIYHVFTMLAYFFPVFGAIISDNWLGKFRTILYVSVIYAAGNILLALASAGPLHIPQVPFSLLALFLIAVGTGGIKPCVAAFGGDQFVLPQQEVQLAAFFSVFYFSINAGSLISTFLTPVLREDVHCFGENSCFPLAFAVPGALMLVSILIFFFGMPLYKILKPEGNVLIEVVKCIWYGAKKNWGSKKQVEHWLDHAEDKFGKSLVKDIKETLRVLVVFVPLPIFYTCYDQQGSGWTFQAARMNGKVGSFNILPDQMQVVNPLLVLAFIPLFNYGVYPLFSRLNILKTPLQRMGCGGFLVAVSFGLAACISLALEANDPVLPSDGNVQLRFYNPSDTDIRLSVKYFDINVTDIEPMGYKYAELSLTGDGTFEYEVNGGGIQSENISEATGYLFYQIQNGPFKLIVDDITKSQDGLPKIRTLVYNQMENINVVYYDGSKEVLNISSTNDSLQSIDPGTYKFGKNEFEFNMGGVYTILANLDDKGNVKEAKYFETTTANNVHILLQLPQYFIITCGEILFSITGYEFSYSQAPVSMKSVLQAFFLLTSAIGNLIIIIIESAKIFDKKSYDFFLYTGLMVLDMLLFTFMATRYKYADNVNNNENEHKPEKKLSIKSQQSTKF